jgi:predicted dehydrogenase
MIDHLAVIGLGSIGRRHLRLARELRPEMRITVVRSGTGKAVPEENLADTVLYGLEDALARGVQAAVLASPAVCHLSQAASLLRSGVHVLVEKPLSHSTDGIDEVLQAWKQSGLVGMVGYCLRHDAAALKFKEMLETQTCGRLMHVRVECGSFLPDWRADQDFRQSVSAKRALGGGVLLELSHELDYIRWFFGPMKSVTAVLLNSGSLGLDVEESADLVFTTASSVPVSVHLDFNTRTTRRSCIARFSDGELAWNAVDRTVVWRSTSGGAFSERFIQDRDDVYRRQLQNFFDSIEKSASPSVSLEEGVEVLRLVEAARASDGAGKTVILT